MPPRRRPSSPASSLRCAPVSDVGSRSTMTLLRELEQFLRKCASPRMKGLKRQGLLLCRLSQRRDEGNSPMAEVRGELCAKRRRAGFEQPKPTSPRRSPASDRSGLAFRTSPSIPPPATARGPSDPRRGARKSSRRRHETDSEHRSGPRAPQRCAGRARPCAPVRRFRAGPGRRR
jgi:hypothetical protein